MERPQNIKQVRSFIGAVTFYRDMWPHRSHILAPLTELTGHAPFVWSKCHQHAFDQMRSLLAEDVLLHYPNHNLPFHIYTDASNIQLCSIIMQHDHPIMYYSRKLSPAHHHYTIYLSFKCSMNSVLCYLVLNSTSILTIAISHLPILLLNAFSSGDSILKNLRLHFISSKALTTQLLMLCPVYLFVLLFPPNLHYWRSDATCLTPIASFSIIMDDLAMLKCFINHPDPNNILFPLDYALLSTQQFDNHQLQQARENDPTKFPILDFGEVQLICYVANPGNS